MQIYKHLVYFVNMSRGLFKMLVWTFQNARVNFANFSCGFFQLLSCLFMFCCAPLSTMPNSPLSFAFFLKIIPFLYFF